jgi:hypothetical protein
MITATGKTIFLGREDIRPSRGYRTFEEVDMQDFKDLTLQLMNEAIAVIYIEKPVANVPPRYKILKSRY